MNNKIKSANVWPSFFPLQSECSEEKKLVKAKGKVKFTLEMRHFCVACFLLLCL